jgi:hypothetical protein
LRSTRPALRLRERVEDAQWIALLETIALESRVSLADPSFSEGAGI